MMILVVVLLVLNLACTAAILYRVMIPETSPQAVPLEARRELARVLRERIERRAGPSGREILRERLAAKAEKAAEVK